MPVYEDGVVAGAGLGDMLKSIYDTDNDSRADVAQALNDASGNSSTAAQVKTHREGNGEDHATVASNKVHSSGNGEDHSTVASNKAHSTGNGEDHSTVASNKSHATGNGEDHSTVTSNKAHATGNGEDHGTVASNKTHATGNGNDHSQVASNRIRTLTFIIDGGGAVPSTGIKGDLEIPFACTINQVTMLADQSGSIVVDIWKDTYVNFPPTDADSITAAAPPTISASNKSQDSSLSGWTTAITAGDILRFNIDSVSTIERVTISLKVTMA